MLTLLSTVARRNDFPSQEVEGVTIMANIDGGYYYGLESIALRIWELLEQPASVAELCGTLAREYDVEAPTCQLDVIEFLSVLEREGLVYIVL